MNKILNREKINFILFGSSKLISVFGSSIYEFAIGLYVLKLTDSGISYAVTLIFAYLPNIFMAPITGVIVDKFDKKKLIIFMDGLNAAMFLILYFAARFNSLNLLIIYISNFLISAFTSIFNIAMECGKPKIVSDYNLLKVNSLGKIIDSLSAILGPVAGGLIYSIVSIKSFIVFNCMSFIISIILEVFIDFDFNKVKSELGKNDGSFIDNIKDGFGIILKKREIISIIFLYTIYNFCISFSVSVPLPIIINKILKLTSKEYAIIEAGFPVGIIIGSILINKIKNINCSKILTSMICLTALANLISAVPFMFKFQFSSNNSTIFYMICMIVIGGSVAFLNMPIILIFQKNIEAEYRGRVWSAGVCMSNIAVPISILLAGMLTKCISSYFLIIIGATILLILGFVIYKNKSIKSIRI